MLLAGSVVPLMRHRFYSHCAQTEKAISSSAVVAVLVDQPYVHRCRHGHRVRVRGLETVAMNAMEMTAAASVGRENQDQFQVNHAEAAMFARSQAKLCRLGERTNRLVLLPAASPQHAFEPSPTD